MLKTPFSENVLCLVVCLFGWVVGFLRQDFSIALEPVLVLALVDQAGFELRDLPASACQVLGLKVCTTTTWLVMFFKTIL